MPSMMSKKTRLTSSLSSNYVVQHKINRMLFIKSILFNLLFCLLHSQFVKAIPYPGSSSIAGTRPRLKSFHFDSNIIDGQTVRVFCQLSDGSQPLSFQWLKDGQPLLHSSSLIPSTSPSSSASSSSTLTNYFDIQTFHDYSSLAIHRVDRRRDSGNYTCLVSNSYGSDQHSSLLIVQEPPSFLEKPVDISIGLKQSTFVMCRATPGHIKPVIKWNRILFGPINSASGLPIDKDARREQISSGEQFHLTDIRIEDAGVYECVAENPHNGLTISHQFTVTVNVPAYFKTKNDQIEVKRGETAKLICESFGAKPIQIVWLRQNVQTGEFEPLNLDYIPESFSFPRYTAIEKNFDVHFDENSSSMMDIMKPLPYVNNNRTLFELHINSVNSFDNGQYGCRARNDFGEDLRRINLFVQDVPAMVRMIQLNQVWTNEASISWLSPETIGNSPITQYIVQYWKETRLTNSTIISSGYRLHEIEVSPTSNLCLIKNLTPGTSYAVRVVAVNQFGRGPSSSLLRFQTEEEIPAASPIDISAEAQGTTSLRIRWKAPPKSHWNGRLKGYYLGYRLISNGNSETTNSVEDSSQQINDIKQRAYAYKQVEFNGNSEDNYQEEFILSGLNRASLYGIILKCFNDVGESPNSHEVYASTAAKDPPPRPTLILVEAKENSVQLKWDQKASNDISHYILFYKEDKKSNWLEIEVAKSILVTDEFDPQYYNYKLAGLHRATVYQMYLRSVGDKSSISEPSEIINVRTEGEVPLVSMLNSNVNMEPSSPQQPFHVAAIPTVFSAHQPTLATYQQQVPPYFRVGFIVPIAIAIVVIVIACVGAYVYIRIDDRNQQMKLYNAAAATNAYMGTLAVGPGKRFQYISPVKACINNNSSTPSSFNSSGVRDSSCTQSLVSEESSLSFRYSDSSSEKGRPLLARAPLPTGVVWAQQQSPIPEEDEAIVEIDSSAYETLPFQKNQQLQSTPMQSFIGGNGVGPVQTNGSNHSQSSFTAKSPPFPPPPPPLPGVIMSKSPLNQATKQQQPHNNNNNIFCHVDVHHAQSSGASDANNSDSYDEFHFFSSPARV